MNLSDRIGDSLVCVVIALGGMVVAPCFGQEAPPPATERAKMFAQGTKEFSLDIDYNWERQGKDVNLQTVTAGFGTYLIDNGLFEVQFLGYRTHDEEDGYGAGVNAYGRYHFLTFDRFSMYGDILGGAFCVSQDFPTGGTGFNFTYGGGPGGSFRLSDNLHLIGGFRFQHVSNGFIEGRDKNPIFNSISAYVGLMWTY